MDKKYRIDTEENRQFMRELGEDLLAFGTSFLPRQGVLIIWGMTEIPGRKWIGRRGSLPAWLMCTA